FLTTANAVCTFSTGLASVLRARQPRIEGSWGSTHGPSLFRTRQRGAARLLPVQLEYDAPMRPDRPSHRDIALHLSVGAARAGGAVRAPPSHQVAHGVATGRQRTDGGADCDTGGRHVSKVRHHEHDVLV